MQKTGAQELIRFSKKNLFEDFETGLARALPQDRAGGVAIVTRCLRRANARERWNTRAVWPDHKR